jgi:hypothetical protein
MDALNAFSSTLLEIFALDTGFLQDVLDEIAVQLSLLSIAVLLDPQLENFDVVRGAQPRH